jgi:crossover junction endodeoxyribonuclease RuvC
MRGILLYEAGRREIDVFEYSPKTVKKGVAGSGGADKGTVKRWVEITLGIKSDQLLDATDALALALNHAQEVLIHQKMKQGLRSEL